MFLIIDGGTTNLRVTLLSDERKPLDAIARDGGVRHTAVDGNNGRLKAAPSASTSFSPGTGWTRAM